MARMLPATVSGDLRQVSGSQFHRTAGGVDTRGRTLTVTAPPATRSYSFDTTRVTTQPSGTYHQTGAIQTIGGAIQTTGGYQTGAIQTTPVGYGQLNSWVEQTDATEFTKYVEVPVVEEQVKYVPRKEYVEIEKRVPKVEVEYVERVVEIPHVEVVERYEDVVEVHEQVKHIPKVQVVDVPKERVKYVPKIETRFIEKEVQVPGKTVEMKKPYLVEQKVVVPRYSDIERETVVAQSCRTVALESEMEELEVEVKCYEPYLIPVDVFIPTAYTVDMVARKISDHHRHIEIPAAHYNSLLFTMNREVLAKVHTVRREVEGENCSLPTCATWNLEGGSLYADDLHLLPFRQAAQGQVTFLGEPTPIVPPVDGVEFLADDAQLRTATSMFVASGGQLPPGLQRGLTGKLDWRTDSGYLKEIREALGGGGTLGPIVRSDTITGAEKGLWSKPGKWERKGTLKRSNTRTGRRTSLIQTKFPSGPLNDH